jgi:DNA-binding response OmpR family regulator
MTRAKDLGADEYVTKPFEPEYLVKVIRDTLHRTVRRVAAR